MSTSNSTSSRRHFTAVKATKVGDSKYKVSQHGILKSNRYSLKAHSDATPSDVAKKVLRRLCELQGKGECVEEFALMETTRGSGKRLFFYKGKSVKLPPSKVKTIKFAKDSSGKPLPKPRIIKITHEHIIEKVDPKSLGHSNPLSGWKAKSK